SATSTLSFTTATGGSVTTVRSVLNVPTAAPFNTGGDGAQTGTQVTFTVSFSTPFSLGLNEHDFFVPQVALAGADQNFFWLSGSPRIAAPGPPFPAGIPDLQPWIRNAVLEPNWLRVGTDIIDGTAPVPTFNGAFSLIGLAVPEPSSLILVGVGALGMIGYAYRRRRTA